MREQSRKEPSQNSSAKATNKHQTNMSSKAEDKGKDLDASNTPNKQEYLTVSSKSRQVRNTTILLSGLFIVGALCLLFMIKKSAPQSASAATTTNEESQIEAAIERLTGIKSEIFDRMEKIVKKFYDFSRVQQVKVDELQKDPFKHELFTDKTPDKSDSENERQMYRQKGEFELLSIMQSAQNEQSDKCCMINNKILYEGDTIKEFKVTKINNNFVKLKSDQTEIVLTLSD